VDECYGLCGELYASRRNAAQCKAGCDKYSELISESIDISNQVLEADLKCPTQEQMKNLNRDSFAEMQTSSSDIAAAEADDQASEEDAKPEPMKLTGLGDLNLLGPVVEQVQEATGKLTKFFGNMLLDKFNLREPLDNTFETLEDFLNRTNETIQQFSEVLPKVLETLCNPIDLISNSSFLTTLARNAKSIEDPASPASSAGEAFVQAADLDFLQALRDPVMEAFKLLKPTLSLDEEDTCVSLLIDVPLLSSTFGAAYAVEFGLSVTSSVMLVAPFCADDMKPFVVVNVGTSGSVDLGAKECSGSNSTVCEVDDKCTYKEDKCMTRTLWHKLSMGPGSVGVGLSWAPKSTLGWGASFAKSFPDKVEICPSLDWNGFSILLPDPVPLACNGFDNDSTRDAFQIQGFMLDIQIKGTFDFEWDKIVNIAQPVEKAFNIFNSSDKLPKFGLSLGFCIPVNIPQIFGAWQTDKLGEYKPFKDISWPTLHPGCSSELVQVEDKVSTSEGLQGRYPLDRSDPDLYSPSNVGNALEEGAEVAIEMLSSYALTRKLSIQRCFGDIQVCEYGRDNVDGKAMELMATLVLSPSNGTLGIDVHIPKVTLGTFIKYKSLQGFYHETPK